MWWSRVFEIGAVYRAEDSYTHRHLCEFTCLDVEMEIKEHYFEVMDIVGQLFVSMFDSSNEKCKKELDAIARQYPFKPLKYLRKTLKLTFQEGVQMLKVRRFFQEVSVFMTQILTARAEASGIYVKKISPYIDAFRYGAPPHRGFGAVVMLFCALNYIRKASLYPRDPKRLVQ